jgi:peptide/nickel transport system substrate-binding protein
LRSTWPLPFYIDPSVGTDGASSTAEYNLYDALIRIDFDGKTIPWVASKWNYSADGMTFNFWIKKGIKFHDGHEMNAEDVAWSMTRFITLGTGRAYVLTPFVQNAVARNATVVRFTLKSTFGPFVSALNTFYILNKDLMMQHLKAGGQYGEMGDYGKEWLTVNDAGSGAYKVKKFNMAEKLVMEKHKDYFGGFNAMSPYIVEMIGTTEAMTVRTMLANKELEISDNWQSMENLKEIKKISGVSIAASMDVSGGWYLMLDVKKAPLDDVHVRRALAYCFDYDQLTTTLFPDTVQMVGPVNTALPGFNPDVFQFHRDITKAKAELALSKYATNITKYKISLHWCAEVPDEEKGSMLFMTNAAEIGIDVESVKTPWTSMVQEASSLETKPHIMYISAAAAYPEAGSLLINRYHSKQALTWWQNEALLNTTLDTAMEDALKITDYNMRMAKYKAIQKDIVNICPSIFMFQAISYRAFPDYVTVPFVKYGKFEKTGSLGNVYSYQGSGGMEFRLFEVNRLVTYAG